MPELPEVENLRQGLEKNIIGQKILHIEIKKPRLVSGKGNIRSASVKKVREFVLGLTGERFVGIERRAKNLIFRLSGGKVVLVHLKMSGQFVYLSKSGQKIIGGHPIELTEEVLPNKHTHIILKLTRGTLYYNDTRMFGYLLYYPNLKKFEAANHFVGYGHEPLDKNFTNINFSTALVRKKGKIKSVLLAQSVVTGLGNIYADECLFAAKIKPIRTVSSLTTKEISALYNAIKKILKRAIKVGGSSVASYRLLDLSRGNYAREHKVYGRSSHSCFRCHQPLRKILIQNRTTVYCNNCQI